MAWLLWLSVTSGCGTYFVHTAMAARVHPRPRRWLVSGLPRLARHFPVFPLPRPKLAVLSWRASSHLALACLLFSCSALLPLDLTCLLACFRSPIPSSYDYAPPPSQLHHIHLTWPGAAVTDRPTELLCHSSRPISTPRWTLRLRPALPARPQPKRTTVAIAQSYVAEVPRASTYAAEVLRTALRTPPLRVPGGPSPGGSRYSDFRPLASPTAGVWVAEKNGLAGDLLDNIIPSRRLQPGSSTPLGPASFSDCQKSAGSVHQLVPSSL
ncbi:hypothetical protein EDB80DRAFT_399141 [Ilyonectria destructans]|nr:hypothetical protein EDB80DRAFT_399141 [Ilyonectria destructans]